VSYLERYDLAHVDPSQGSFDALGAGESEGKAAPNFISKGLTRSRADKLQVVAAQPSSSGSSAAVATAKVTAFGGAQAHGHAATALKAEPEAKLSPAQQLEVGHAQAAPQASAKALASERRAEAKAKGYEGEMCGECGNFTLVRNGTCMKCDTCGATSGCS
jgi:ribonucleoside-diphosphate reductase alpha chain